MDHSFFVSLFCYVLFVCCCHCCCCCFLWTSFFAFCLSNNLPESLSNHSISSSFLVKSSEVENKCRLFCLHTSQFSRKHIMMGPKRFLPEIQSDGLNEITRGDLQEGVCGRSFGLNYCVAYSRDLRTPSGHSPSGPLVES